MGQLLWSRGNELPDVLEPVTRRELFSVCGVLTGHYPVAGWLRVACSFVKRNSEGSRWDDLIGDRACTMLQETIQKVRRQDPVSSVAASLPSNSLLVARAGNVELDRYPQLMLPRAETR